MKLSGHKIQAISKVGPPTISILTYSNTSITVTWTNRTEPLISYYAVYYSTSQNGTYTKANDANNTTSSPYQISGLTQGQTYYIYVRAVDTSGNLGPVSNIVSQALTAFTIPDITFTQGVSFNYDLSQHYTIPAGQSFVSLTLVQGDLDSANSGISLNSASQELVYDGVGLAVVKTGLVIRLTTNVGTIDSTSFSTTIEGTDSQLTWLQDLSSPIVVPRGGSFDLSSYYTDPQSELSTIQSEDPSATETTSILKDLPDGVTIESNPYRLVAASDATLGTSTEYRFRLVPTTEADWQSRISSPGVLAYENFSTYANRAEWMTHLQSVYVKAGNQRGANETYTNAPGGTAKFQDPVPVGEIERLGLSTSQYLSGTQSAYHRFIGGSGSGYQNGGPMWQFWFSDSGVQEVYLQWHVRFESAWLNHDHNDGTSEGRKILIFGEYDFANGETGIDMRRMTFPSLWHVTGSFNHFQANWSSGTHPGSGTLNQRFAMLDRGSPSPVTTITDWYTRYGYEGNVGSTDQAPANSKYAGLGIPVIEADKWYTFMIYQNQSYVATQYQQQRGAMKFWMSERGQSPILVSGGLFNADLNTGAIKSARIMIRTEGVASVQPTTGGCYTTEVIASTQPIPWPVTGETVPFPGTTIPTNYPPATISGVTEG